MNYFFSFTPTTIGQPDDFIFTLNHLMLAFVVVAVLCALFFGLHAKSKKGQRITLLVIACTILTLELGRIIWIILHRTRYLDMGFDMAFWVRAIPFSVCGIMSFTTLTTLLVSFFKKDTQSRGLQLFYNILLGTALTAGVMAFIIPQLVLHHFSLLHFRNFQTIVNHIFLIFVPIYLIKIGWLKVRMKNLWMPAVGFIGVGSILMTGSQVSGQNLGEALYSAVPEMAGLTIAFPWHYLFIFSVVFLLPTGVFGVFEWLYKRKGRGVKVAEAIETCDSAQATQDEVSVPTVTSSTVAWYKDKNACIYASMIFGTVLLGLLALLLIPMSFSISPITSGLGLLCLIPLCILIGGIYAALYVRQKLDTRMPTPQSE